MRRAGYVVVGVSLLAWAVLAPILLALERGGPEHRDVTLAGDIPATFYLPDTHESSEAPAVVVGHGYSGDRATMSSLSRSLAEAGYAVLAIDFSGHGANEHPFDEADRAADLAAALDWLEASPDVDPDRLAVLAHSMGAHAALDLATTDPRPLATVVLGSSHRPLVGDGPVPRDVLFLVGAYEAASVRRASDGFAAELERAGEDAEVVEIAAADHIRILWLDETVAESVAWLDRALGVERDEPPGIVDPRLAVALVYFVCVLVATVCLGAAVARGVPRLEERPPAGLRVFGAVAAALAVAVPVSDAVDESTSLGTGFGDVVTFLGAAGVVLALILRVRPSKPPPGLVPRVALAGALSLAGAFVLLAPLGGISHRLVPTPIRAVIAVVVTIVLLPFFTLLHGRVRRGSVARATLASGAAHVLILIALAAGVVLEHFPEVVGLALPLLLGVFALVELFALGAYSVARSGVLIGVVEAGWIAGLAAVAMPLP